GGTGTRSVVHYHWLAPNLRELLAYPPANDVEAAAGRIRNNHPHGLGGVALSKGARGYGHPSGKHQRDSCGSHGLQDAIKRISLEQAHNCYGYEDQDYNGKAVKSASA